MPSKYLIFIVALLSIFTLSCKEEASNECNAEGEVIAYITDKCGCCSGWLVVKGNDTLKFETVPENDYMWHLVNCLGFPQDIKFSYEKTSDDCANVYHKMTCVHFDVDLSAAFMPCDSTCMTQSHIESDISLANRWDFLGIYHEENSYQECYPLADNPIHITINNSGELSGQSACNLYFGTFDTLRSESVEISGLGQTEMYCNDSLVWSWEGKYLDYLLNAQSYQLIGQQLWLHSSDDMVLVYILSDEE